MSSGNNRLRHPILTHQHTKVPVFRMGRARLSVERTSGLQVVKMGRQRVSRTYKAPVEPGFFGS